MATTRSCKSDGKGTVSNRWNLIIEIEKPYAASLEQFHQRFHVTKLGCGMRPASYPMDL